MIPTNWRTTLFGGIALIAAFITQYPGLLSAVLDPESAKKVAALAALVSGFVAFCHTKDRQVSGNGTIDAPNQVAQGDGTSKTISPLLVALLLPSLFLSGCGTPAGNAFAAFLDSPANQKIIQAASNGAGASLAASIGGDNVSDAEREAIQVATSAIVNGVSSGVASAAAMALRTKQGTPQAASMPALAAAVAVQGDRAQTIAPAVASAVAKLTAVTGNPDASNEAVAAALDAVAAKGVPSVAAPAVKPLDGASAARLRAPFATIDFRHERIVDPSVASTGSVPPTSAAVWMRPLIVTREDEP